MNIMRNFRQESRKSYGRSMPEDQWCSNDELNVGSLQRIADACDLMAKDRERMERELKWKTAEVERLKKGNESLGRSNAALRGVIKRMKKLAK
jgi:hypothetical protein